MNILKSVSRLGIAITIFLFTYTGLSKLIYLSVFQIDLSKSVLIPQFWAKPLSFLIPLAEVLVAIGLITQKYFTISLKGAIILFLLFTLYITFIYFFSPDIPCSCGGIISDLSWIQHLMLNILILTLLLIALNLKIEKLF